jgi:hypothetical protein
VVFLGDLCDLRVDRREWASGGAIEKVSNRADNQQDDNDDRANDERHNP